MFIYSVYDKKALDFGPLFTSQNDDTAMRIVSVNLLGDTMLSTNPSDFSLYCLGEYNSDNGDVSGINPIKLVCEILFLIKVDKDKESGTDSVSLQPRQA